MLSISGTQAESSKLCITESRPSSRLQLTEVWALSSLMRSQRLPVLVLSDTGHSIRCYALGPLLPKQVWAIRARLELASYPRDLALFNVAIDSKLRGCDLVKLTVTDLVKEDRVRERVSVIQSKTKKQVQFELTENTRDSVLVWVKSPEMFACQFMFPSRFHDRPHISTRQYGRLVRDWVTSIGLEPSAYGTHSLRRTKAAEIYRKTGNLRAVQLLLGHTKVDSTVRYLGVELEDALSIAERIDI